MKLYFFLLSAVFNSQRTFLNIISAAFFQNRLHILYIISCGISDSNLGSSLLDTGPPSPSGSVHRLKHSSTLLGILNISIMTPFFNKSQDFCTKFELLNDFFKRRTSNHFQAEEFRNMRAFELF